jgi:hypothetical protein
MANKIFGPFQLTRLIGSGGMASVYDAIDTRTQQRVALKTLHVHLTYEQEVVKRFQREAQLIRSLDHPYIVPIYDSGQIGRLPYIAMKFMPGGSLAGAFRVPRQAALETSERLLRQIAAALEHAHSQGIIHRDIKLENVLLDENGEAAISDFGIARVRDGTRYTQTGDAIGTPLWMAPEQIAGRADVDHRSDVYALAVMTYLFTTGYFPFTGDNPMTVMNKQANAAPPPPSLVNADLPTALDAVILKGLAKRPEDRYLSARDLIDAYSGALTTLSRRLSVLVDLPRANPFDRDGAVGPADRSVGVRTGVIDAVNPPIEGSVTGTAGAIPTMLLPEEPERKRRGVLWIVGLGVLVLLAGGFVLQPLLRASVTGDDPATPVAEGTAEFIMEATPAQADPEALVTSTPTRRATRTTTAFPSPSAASPAGSSARENSRTPSPPPATDTITPRPTRTATERPVSTPVPATSTRAPVIAPPTDSPPPTDPLPTDPPPTDPPPPTQEPTLEPTALLDPILDPICALLPLGQNCD